MKNLNELYTEAFNDENAVEKLKALDIDKDEKLTQYIAYVDFFVEHKLCKGIGRFKEKLCDDVELLKKKIADQIIMETQNNIAEYINDQTMNVNKSYHARNLVKVVEYMIAIVDSLYNYEQR